MEIYQIFKQTMDRNGIMGKDLSTKAGITPNHLSDFRSGKKSITLESLERLLVAMEELAPGSRFYFCQLLAEKPLQKQIDIVRLIETARDEEIEAAMQFIGKKWKESRRECSKLTVVESDTTGAMAS